MEMVNHGKYGKFLDHGQAKPPTYQTKYSCTQLCPLDFEVAGQLSLSPPSRIRTAVGREIVLIAIVTVR